MLFRIRPMRFCILLFLAFTCSLRASHTSVFEKLNGYTPVLSFTESVAQHVVGSGADRLTEDAYSAKFQIIVETDDLATLNATSIVRIRIGSFLFDKTLGDAPDYVAGGTQATFRIIDGMDPIGTVKAKWGNGKLTISGSIKSPFLPMPVNSFQVPVLVEDDRYFISETTEASLIFGDTSGSRKIEVQGKSTFKSVRFGPADSPDYEDDLWKVSITGALDFTPPTVKLLSPGKLTNATPQRYVLSTPLDAEVVTVQVDLESATDPILRESLEPPLVKPKQALWDGVLYLAAGANNVRFTTIDRSGNSSTTTFTLTHDWRSGIYSGILDPGSDEMTRILTLNVAPGGKFTGQLQLGLDKYRFKNEFDNTGFATFQLPRSKGRVPLDFVINVTQDDSDFTGEPDPKPTVLSVVISDESGSYTIDATRAVYDSESVQPDLLSAYYTARISPDPLLEGTGGPEGSGYLTMRAKNNGSIRTLGKVADGSPFSCSGPLGGDGRLLVFSKLYKPTDGFVQGFVTFTAAEDQGSTCEGSVRWVQPSNAKATGLFPNGVNADCPVSGGIYLPARRIVDEGNIDDTTPLGTSTEGELRFSGGDFGGSDSGRLFGINYKGTVTFTPPHPEEKLKLSVKNKTGIFSGRILAPGHASPAKKFFGVIVGQEGLGEGGYTSKTDSGAVAIEAQ